MSKTNQLPPDELSDEYVRAINLTHKIMAAAQVAQQNLYDMCMGLKEVRDGRLYKELGYSDFGDYCERAVGFKRYQAYKYISVIEKLPKEFVAPGQQIGIKKLYLLSTLSEQERTEITEKNNLESLTVRELEQQIKTLKTEKDRAVAEQSAAQAQASAKDGTIEALRKTNRELENHIGELRNEIIELENRPIDIAVQDCPDDWIAPSAYEDMVKTYTEQLAQKDDEFIDAQRKAYEEIGDLKKQLAEAENAEPEKVTVPDTEGVFKVYFTNAYNVLNELVRFTQEHTEYIQKVNVLVENIKKSMEVSS